MERMKVMKLTPFYTKLAFVLLSLISLVQALSEDEIAFFDALGENDPDEAFRLLRDNGIDINIRGPGGQTPLMYSVLGGKEKAVKALLEEGADVTIGEKDGYTPLHGAGFQGRAEVAKILIDHGLDPLGMHEDGYIAMHRACWAPTEAHAETVKVFIDAGVPYNFESKDLKACMTMTKNSGTIEVLNEAAKEAAATKDGNGDEL